MELLRLVGVFLHFLGLASLLGGFLTQLSAAVRRVVPAMTHGALTQLATGVLLVGVDQGLGRQVDNVKIAVKLAVLCVILVLIWPNRAKLSVSKATFWAVGGLSVLNVAIAVFWP